MGRSIFPIRTVGPLQFHLLIYITVLFFEGIKLSIQLTESPLLNTDSKKTKLLRC